MSLRELWEDYLRRVAGSDWMAKPGERVLWRTLGEVYVQLLLHFTLDRVVVVIF
jgi:hypothetical protein